MTPCSRLDNNEAWEKGTYNKKAAENWMNSNDVGHESRCEDEEDEKDHEGVGRTTFKAVCFSANKNNDRSKEVNEHQCPSYSAQQDVDSRYA